MPLTPKGRIRWAVLALALTVSGAMPAAAGAKSSRSEVIVQLEGGRSGDHAKSLVRRSGGRVTGALPIINGFAARVDARTAAALEGARGVHAVTRNGGVEPQAIRASEIDTAYPFATGAANAWNEDVTGKGVGVAVIDTGIAGNLRDFRSSGADRSRVVASAVIHPGATKAGDSYGHGTHVAGIIAGNSWNRSWLDPGRGRYVGVAPEANLIDVKISDEEGNATILDVLYGLQFVMDHKEQLGIRVVNLSLEATTPGSYKTDPLNAAVEAAWFDGLVVVAASGNRGAAEDAVSYAPGNDPYVISVGGLDDRGTRAQSDDVLAPWSARGRTADGIAKPDIVAPGARIVSNLAPSSAFSMLCPACILNGGMIRAGGTSMAAPMVAGVAALLLERYPHLTPDQVKGVLKASARELPGALSTVDAKGALARAASGNVPAANAGLVPNELIDAATGKIDYTRSSWSRSSWSSSEGQETADWARSSWSRSSWSSTNSGDSVDPSRSSWSRSSWSTSWTK